MNRTLGAIVASVMLVCLGGCVNASIEGEPKPNISTALPSKQEITATGVHINLGDISFGGHSGPTDGRYLQTQFYADNQLAVWWPTNKYIQVQHGKWQITVSLTGLSEDVTRPYTGGKAEFRLKRWEKDALQC